MLYAEKKNYNSTCYGSIELVLYILHVLHSMNFWCLNPTPAPPYTHIPAKMILWRYLMSQICSRFVALTWNTGVPI